MFYLDLDELEDLEKQFTLLGYHKKGLWRFSEADHLKFEQQQEQKGNLHFKQRVLDTLSRHGVSQNIQKIYLLTHLRFAGYVFNPVSLYYCFDDHNTCQAILYEVNNTFLEQKAFLFEAKNAQRSLKTVKNFYVSPFIATDELFQFWADAPSETLTVSINTLSKGNEQIILKGDLQMTRATLNLKNLAYFALRYNFMPQKVISNIHFQALKLWLKKIKYYKKTELSHA